MVRRAQSLQVKPVPPNAGTKHLDGGDNPPELDRFLQPLDAFERHWDHFQL